MKKANAFLLLAVVALLVLAPAGVFAQRAVDPEGAPQFAGHAYYDMITHTLVWDTNPAPLADVDIYSNTASSPLFGFSSSDLNATFGDELFTTGTGTLDQNDFTIFNPTSSAGSLLTATVTISLFDGPSSTFLGGYNTNLNFGSGLPRGFFSIVTVTNLAGAGIVLPGTDVIITQKIASKTGPASRLGIASLSPITIGASIPAMFINAADVGPAGFYTVSNQPSADPGYRLAILEAVPSKATTWGNVKGKYHGN